MGLERFPAPLVSTAWLAAHLGEPALVVVDASWYLAAMQRDGHAEYRAGHLPGAVFWDLDALSDRSSDLPHMLPDPDTLAGDIGGLGIGNGDRVVVYDGSGVNLSAARVWWTFRVAGHTDVAVLDGGLPRWRAEGRPLEAGEVIRPAVPYVVRFRSELVRSMDQLRDGLAGGAAQLLDARSRGRFAGTEPEPRPGLRGGHIPGSRNLPFLELVGPDGLLRSPEELRRLYRDAGIDLSRPIVTSCGSGATACALTLGLALLGVESAVYDGSWSEWGANPEAPVATGA